MLKDFTRERFDIIVQAGQSNSDGTGYGSVQQPYVPNDRVWYMLADFTLTTATETVEGNAIRSNYSLAFAREYMERGLLEPDRKVLILRTSVGGTGFLDHRWGMTDDLYLRMMGMIRTALALNEQNRLVAFLWHQGETDAIFQADHATHYNNLMGLVRSVRETFRVAELPFVAGDFVQQWKKDNWQISEPVVTAIEDVCRDCGRGIFVQTEGLASNMQDIGDGNEDTIHFSRRSLYELGKRYFDGFEKLQNL